MPEAEIIAGDARRVDWATILRGEPAVLVANLPYNLATPIVADLLDDVPLIERMLVMVQAEVGERLAAPPGTKAYGAVSVKVAYWAEATVVGRVPPTVFLPRPKVDSALVAIRRRPVPAGPASVAPDELFALVRAGFGQRRKTLRRSLAGTWSSRQTSPRPASIQGRGPSSSTWLRGAGWRRPSCADEGRSMAAPT